MSDLLCIQKSDSGLICYGLDIALKVGCENCVRRICEKNPREINFHILQRFSGISSGFYPFGYAIEYSTNPLKMIDVLAELGADINAIDDYGFTPLKWAVKNRSIECVKKLIEFGANIPSYFPDGIQTVEYARYRCKHDMVEFFESYN